VLFTTVPPKRCTRSPVIATETLEHGPHCSSPAAAACSVEATMVGEQHGAQSPRLRRRRSWLPVQELLDSGQIPVGFGEHGRSISP